MAPSRHRLIPLVGWSGQLGRERLAVPAVNDGLRAVEAGKLSESLSPSAQARPFRLARAASKASELRSRPTLLFSEVCAMRVAFVASREGRCRWAKRHQLGRVTLARPASAASAGGNG